MNFLEKYNNFMSVLSEQDQPQAPVDAAAPDPNAQPQQNNDTGPQAVAPEGYVSMVKMLAKALAMDIPAGEIDSIFTGTNVTEENAFEIQNELKKVMNENEVQSNNIERLNNPNLKKFIESVDEKNFMQKYNVIVNAMKTKSPYVQ